MKRLREASVKQPPQKASSRLVFINKGHKKWKTREELLALAAQTKQNTEYAIQCCYDELQRLCGKCVDSDYAPGSFSSLSSASSSASSSSSFKWKKHSIMLVEEDDEEEVEEDDDEDDDESSF